MAEKPKHFHEHACTHTNANQWRNIFTHIHKCIVISFIHSSIRVYLHCACLAEQIVFIVMWSSSYIEKAKKKEKCKCKNYKHYKIRQMNRQTAIYLQYLFLFPSYWSFLSVKKVLKSIKKFVVLIFFWFVAEFIHCLGSLNLIWLCCGVLMQISIEKTKKTIHIWRCPMWIRKRRCEFSHNWWFFFFWKSILLRILCVRVHVCVSYK